MGRGEGADLLLLNGIRSLIWRQLVLLTISSGVPCSARSWAVVRDDRTSRGRIPRVLRLDSARKISGASLHGDPRPRGNEPFRGGDGVGLGAAGHRCRRLSQSMRVASVSGETPGAEAPRLFVKVNALVLRAIMRCFARTILLRSRSMGQCPPDCSYHRGGGKDHIGDDFPRRRCTGGSGVEVHIESLGTDMPAGSGFL